MSDTKRYVLVYAGLDKKGNADNRYFVGQNLYLGIANITDSLELATIMSLEEAEKVWGLMAAKKDWQIWSIRDSIVLYEESDRHLLMEKRKRLSEELMSIDLQLNKNSDGHGERPQISPENMRKMINTTSVTTDQAGSVE